MELLNLKQVGSVEEYRRNFEQLIYHIRLFDNSLSGTMMTAQFMLRLRDDIRHHVETLLLDSVAKAATLASIQEHLLQKKTARISDPSHKGKHLPLINRTLKAHSHQQNCGRPNNLRSTGELTSCVTNVGTSICLIISVPYHQGAFLLLNWLLSCLRLVMGVAFCLMRCLIL
jgi:hypothetical protein